jgi:hypothetical protein
MKQLKKYKKPTENEKLWNKFLEIAFIANFRVAVIDDIKKVYDENYEAFYIFMAKMRVT